LAIISNIALNSFSGILLLLFATIQPPFCVSQTFVEFGVGDPFDM